MKARSTNPFYNPRSSAHIPQHEVSYIIADFLDAESLGAASQVCHAWESFFGSNTIWSKRMACDFGITPAMLDAHTQNSSASSLTYKQVYQTLAAIKRCQKQMPRYIKNFIRHHLHGECLLAIATDNADLLLNLIAPEDQPQWFQVSLYTECDDIPLRLFQEQYQGAIMADYFEIAILANHQGIYEHVTRNHAGQGLAFSQRSYQLAIRSGSPTMLENVRKQCGYSYINGQKALHDAIRSGNLEQVKFITSEAFGITIDPTDNKALDLACEVGAIDIAELLIEAGIKPNHNTLNYSARGGLATLRYWLDENKYQLEVSKSCLDHAAVKGFLKSVKFLLDPEQNFALEPDLATLNLAAKSGNLKLIKELLNYNILPDEATLNLAAKSGCVPSVRYLLEQFKLPITIRTVNHAASSGNLNMLKYLFNQSQIQHKEITPDTDTLRSAITSHSLEITRFLLNPFNDFYQLSLEKIHRLFNLEFSPASNSSLTSCLLPCHSFILSAIESLRDDDQQNSDERLGLAYELAPQHFCTMMQHIIQYPENYNLTSEQVDWLKQLECVNETLTSLSNNDHSGLNLPGL